MSRASAQPAYLIEAHGLTRVFNGSGSLFQRKKTGGRTITAVDQIDLALHAGEIFGLVGPNGAGKTTLIKILTNMLLPTSGSATIDGYDVAREGHHVRKRVGLVTSNERSFYWRLTGRQNLAFFADLYHLHPTDARRWMDELFNLLGLEQIADKRFDAYSTGQRQRLAMARGLLSKPKILFMDEPTKGVDPIGAAEIVRIIRDQVIDLWNPTILVTSHNLNEIQMLCKRIALMNHGRMIAVGSLDELRRMVDDSLTYELRIGRLAENQLSQIAADCHAALPAQIGGRNGAVELQVSFKRQSDGFAQFIRTVIESGGDLLHCSEIELSFDNIFHYLIGQENRKRETEETE